MGARPWLGLSLSQVALALVVVSSCGNGTGAPSAAASATSAASTTDAAGERSERGVITRNDGVPEDSGALPAAPRETGRWEEVSVPTDGVTVYDAARGRVVLFASGQTWLWDGTTWARQAPRSSPPTLSYETMVYDARRSRAVLFGGRGPYGDQSETWTWDGNDWAKLATSAAPSARESSMMAYDVARDRVVLFGGTVMRSGSSASEDSALGDTWTFDGTTWAKAAPASSPPPSAYGYLVDDEATGKLVLFGNQDADQFLAGNATWLWDGATWSEAAPTTVPVEQTAFTMAYDPATQQVVEIGTSFGTNAYVGYTWNGQTNNWTSLTLPTFQPALSNIELASIAPAGGSSRWSLNPERPGLRRGRGTARCGPAHLPGPHRPRDPKRRWCTTIGETSSSSSAGALRRRSEIPGSATVFPGAWQPPRAPHRRARAAPWRSTKRAVWRFSSAAPTVRPP